MVKDIDNKIEIYKGDTEDVRLLIKEIYVDEETQRKLKRPFDLTDFSSKLMVKASIGDSNDSALIEVSGVNDVDPTTGYITFSFTHDDTNISAGEYIYDVRLYKVSGEEYSEVKTPIKNKPFVILDSVNDL
jgi:hypothetical protein